MKLALALVPTTAAALAAGRTVMEPDVTVFEAPNWVRGERVAASALIELEFWLKHDAADLAAFHDDLVERSTPGSAKYSDWLSKEEVRAMLAPSREALDAVLDYVVHDLGAADVHVDDFKSVVSVAVPAGPSSARFDTKLWRRAHVDYAHVEVIRVGEAYSLPAAVAAHVSLVSELVRFPRLRPVGPRRAAVGAAPERRAPGPSAARRTAPTRTPTSRSCGFEFPLTDAADGNSMAVAEFQGQYWDPKDLGAFSTACGLPSAISVSKTVGGNVPLLCEGLGQGCVESLLDISTRAVSPARSRSGPNTGVSILFAAGDQGVWGREGPGLKYHPDFPPASPLVAAVGGTDFATKSVIGDETTWNDGGSGFSNEFAQPAWQADDVAAYLKSAVGPKAHVQRHGARTPTSPRSRAS
ncbi:C2 domain-containing protein [Aureococcus anophagefferens]|nr:C2 domain-containing protein [Aureococcus anophagefferens]